MLELNRPDQTFTYRLPDANNLNGSFRWGRATPIRFVVIHHAAMVNATMAAVHGVLNGRRLSCHAVVRDGAWSRGVADRDTAFTNGTNDANAGGLNVEIVNAGGESTPPARPDAWRISDASWETAAQLTAAWHRAHGLGRPSAATVRGHRQFVATRCPGEFVWTRFPQFIARAAAIFDGATTPPEPEPIPIGDLAMSYRLVRDASSSGIWFVPLYPGHKVAVANTDDADFLRRIQDALPGAEVRLYPGQIDRVLRYINEAATP